MNINFNNINWDEVFSQDFWFSVDRAAIHLSDKLFLYAGIALVALGIIVLAYRRFIKNQFLARVAGRFAKIFLTIGLLEGAWYLLRIQFVQALGTRFLAGLLLLWGLVWLYWPIKYLLRNYKVDMEQASRAASREKYLQK